MGMKMALVVSLNIQMNFPLFVFTEDDERTKWRKLMSGRKVSSLDCRGLIGLTLTLNSQEWNWCPEGHPPDSMLPVARGVCL